MTRFSCIRFVLTGFLCAITPLLVSAQTSVIPPCVDRCPPIMLPTSKMFCGLMSRCCTAKRWLPSASCRGSLRKSSCDISATASRMACSVVVSVVITKGKSCLVSQGCCKTASRPMCFAASMPASAVTQGLFPNLLTYILILQVSQMVQDAWGAHGKHLSSSPLHRSGN